MKCKECDSALNTLKNHCHEPSPLVYVEPLKQLVTTVQKAEREATAKRLESWLEEDNQLVFHDQTCDKSIKENPIEWHCDCFLDDIVQRIKVGG